MTVRINANSCKNALGTVFLLATTFFVCSTFISMRSVFADPIAPTNTNVAQSGRQSPRSTTRSTSNRTVSRATTSRGTVTPTRATVSRGTAANRTVSSRSVTSSKRPVAASRSVASRTRNTNQTSNRSVRARSGKTQSRVSATGNVMSSGSRASIGTTYAYLNSRLNTGNYSSIIDSTTGMIAADAYANCMDSYYACMDEICTARNETRGRCSCAGRATNFIEAEEALERANEELIVLSGQLALLVATKGKGDDLSAAFSLTEAEQVMNCVSWRDTAAKCSTTDWTDDPITEWYQTHPTYSDKSSTANLVTEASCSNLIEPYYCKTDGNNFGFDITDINGSSSDILAQLKSWAEAKEQVNVVLKNDESNLGVKTTAIANIVKKLSNNVSNIDESEKDNMSKKWGYKLFEYAHNNVCGRVLDSCFNGIYEACGTPPKVTDSDKNTHNKCMNGSTSSCPFNYNSYISVDTNTSSDKYGDVVLNERGSKNDNASTSATCFGYTTTTASTGVRTTASTVTSDPYYSLRGPVADARRSIMQKYLLDANAACDVYGAALKNTAQNINYQKVAAEQALQQKRLEFRQQEESSTQSNYATYASNFVSCMDELYDCYTIYSTEGWTTARVKTYCAQKSQVPSCYEPMVCSPSHLALKAVIDKADNPDKNGTCFFAQDFRDNTCRNVVTISEILYGANSNRQTLAEYSNLKYNQDYDSTQLRESCLQESGVTSIRNWSVSAGVTYECTEAELYAVDENAATGHKYTQDILEDGCPYIDTCNSGYIKANGRCAATTQACTQAELNTIAHATAGLQKLVVKPDGTWSFSGCQVTQCATGYHVSGGQCEDNEQACPESVLPQHAESGTRTWNESTRSWNKCIIDEGGCETGYALDANNNKCVEDGE